MRIGVFGDTHDHVANIGRACALFNEARVDRVVHTGDITTVDSLLHLTALEAPAAAVLGNNDWDRDGLLERGTSWGLDMAAHVLELSWGGRKIVVVHDPEDPAASSPSCDLVLHGHTHRTRAEWVDRANERPKTLVVNPGECASTHQGRNCIAIVDLAAMSYEIVRF